MKEDTKYYIANKERVKLQTLEINQSEVMKRKKSTIGRIRKAYTQEEDNILRLEMERNEKINFSVLAQQLKRSYSSVKNRCKILRNGKGCSSKQWTLAEDQVLIDLLIAKLKTTETNLISVDVTNKETKCLSLKFHRHVEAVIERLRCRLK